LFGTDRTDWAARAHRGYPLFVALADPGSAWSRSTP